MHTISTTLSASRVDIDHRHRTTGLPRNREPGPVCGGTAEERACARRHRLRRAGDISTMGRDHRFFHRRAAQAATQVITVNVEIVATVDTNGSLIAQETVTPQPPQTPQSPQTPSLPTVAAAAAVSIQPVASVSPPVLPSQLPVPQLPTVPAVPTVPVPSLPSVPSVPPFPSDLVVPTVPSFPWPSGVPATQAVVSTGVPVPSPVPTSALESSAASLPASASTFAAGLNSTTPTVSGSFAQTLAPLSLESISISGSSTPRTSIVSTQVPSSASSSDISSAISTTPSDAASTIYPGGGGGGNNAPGIVGVPPAATTSSAADAGASSDPAPLETPQVVGSVVGSLAGAALILAIILLLIRRHKRQRGGVLQLTGDDHTEDHPPISQAPMRSSVLPAAFLHRFSGMSKSTAETSTSGGERSFQRVSGRKLPSAFSEGMTSEQFSRGGTISGSSFYQDDQGTYGSPGISKEFGKEIGQDPTTRDSGPMNIRPSPARTPIIRHPDDAPPFGFNRSHLSPPQSPNPDIPAKGTLGRSLPSADGSRSSRFTENV